jgi:hypothetical protein
MVVSMQEKLKIMQSKHEEKLNEMKETLNFENDVSKSLRDQLNNQEDANKRLEASIKEVFAFLKDSMIFE